MQCVVCNSKEFSMFFRRGDRYVSECTSCGLAQVLPMYSTDEIGALYHEDMDHFEPYLAQIQVHRAYFRNKVREIRSTVIPGLTRDLPSKKVGFRLMGRNDKKLSLLDIGCAMGVLLEEGKKQGFNVTGVDISEDAAKYCRKKGLKVFVGTLKSLSSTPGVGRGFDVITAFEIIEHERDPRGMMRRVYKLLNKGGITVLTTPNHSSIFRKLMGKWWFGYTHPEHVTFWSSQSLTELLERVGFKNIVVRHDEPRPFPLSFAFTRSADYFPFFAFILRPIGKFFDRFKIKNPINPWDDLIIIGQK